MRKNISIDKIAKSLIIVAFIVLALYFFTNVLMPIIFSGIASLILLPIVKFFDRIGVNKTLSVTLTVLIMLIFASGIIFVLVFQSQSIVVELPKLMNENENFLNI